jgi:hypothetical protein
MMMPYGWVLPFVLLFLSQVPRVGAQTRQFSTPFQEGPQELVREVVENSRRLREDPTYWSYRETVHKDGRLETHELCQTPAGTIDRLIAINNQPLSVEQQRREGTRVKTLLASPAEMRKERLKQREDAAKQYRMFATFPDAFRYQYAGTEGGLVKLKFEPNLRFVPDTRQEEVFHHLEGTMWIDPERKQLARIDGQLTSEVRFAGGMLGHLDKGGIFSVRFRQVVPSQWLMSALEVDMSGRALIFKTISVQEQREFDDYHRVPADLTLRQAAELLEKTATSVKQSAANTTK